jgi:ATP-dependent DNA helicase RecG
LTEVHSPQPYNPSIANCFFRAGFVESWGRGTLEIIRECVEYEIPEPTFTFDSGVWIEFKGKEEKISSEKMSGKMSGKILALMTQNQRITISELAKTIKVTDKTIERALKNMKASRMIERIGPDKGGYWQVIER